MARHGRDGERAQGSQPRAVLRVRMLGGFEISIGGAAVAPNLWRRRKAAALVKVLALEPGRRMHRERVMNLLWPDLDAGAAANNLRYSLYVARGAMKTTAPAGASCLSLRDEQLILYPDGPVRVDVDEFLESAAAASRSRDPAVYRMAIELYAGELLPADRFEIWTENRRDDLGRTYRSLHVGLAFAHEERGESGPAVDALERAVAEEPGHEEAHAGLMRLHARAGRRNEALRWYQRLARALVREGNPEPSAATRSLREEISSGRFPAQGTRLAASSSVAWSETRDAVHNLPAARTSFVGRERELVEVRRILLGTRLLTLTGVGGCGKTRLAVEVARGIVQTFAGGVWLVRLAPLSDPALVPQAAVETFKMPEQPGRSLVETLVDALNARGKTLLFLDNCEHLVEAVARLAGTLLDSCPDLWVLATSREALLVAGETTWSVPPLTLPEHGPGDPPARGLRESEAARLFAERAMQRSSGFALDGENARAVAEICGKLEGIPLAIELAAARMGTLSAGQISARLSDSLELLTGGGRTTSPRHQTLRGTLDWSHELLEESEKSLFARLWVFAGGWTLEAAEVVGTGQGVEARGVLDLVSRLADKSLVVVEAHKDGEMRFRLLEPVRQYARERLEERHEVEEMRRRHAAWYLALAEEAERGSVGPGRVTWLRRLETEHDNLRAALGWALGGGDADLGLRLAGSLWLFWFTQGYSSEGRGWLEKGILLGGSKTARAKALNGAGWVVLFRGDSETAKTFLEESVILYRELEDEEGLASSLNFLGFVALLGGRGDIPVAALLEEALALKPRIENRQTIANTLVFAALDALFQRGAWDETVALHEEALALFRDMDDRWGMGLCLTNLGLLEAAQQHHARATELLRELMRRSLEIGDKFAGQYSFFGLACVADSQGRTARAARLWGRSEAMREAAGFRLPHAALVVLNYEGRLTNARARLGDAAFEEAWAEGKAMPLEEAVEYALSKEEPETERPPEPSAVLTRREREVAVLVARGLTNRQISAQLGISERTAGNHVARMLQKLGFRSRAQIATWVTERRMLASDPD